MCLYSTLINSRLHWALLISASSGITTMSLIHVEGPVQSFIHFVIIWMIRYHRPARLCMRLPLTLPRSSLSQVVALPRAPLALVPLARVQKLEAQIVTLLQHIHPWMQRSIAEVEERVEQRMVQHTEWKIAEVHQRLDAFDL